jgi:hypothetical protein
MESMTMPIASHFRDGETAFMDGAPLDQNPYRNPYMADQEAAKEWRAGWLTASNTVRSIEALGELGGWTEGIIY